MNRIQVEWLASIGDEDDKDFKQMKVRIREEWVAVDSDQLILPITVIDKSTISVEESYPALLKQYGGESLLNDMLMSDQKLEAGSKWTIMRDAAGLGIQPLDE